MELQPKGRAWASLACWQRPPGMPLRDAGSGTAPQRQEALGRLAEGARWGPRNWHGQGLHNEMESPVFQEKI